MVSVQSFPSAASSSGTPEWSDPMNVTAADFQWASCSIGAFGSQSGFLIANMYGFDIPENAVVTGVQVEIRRRRSSAAVQNLRDSTIRLTLSGGTSDGQDKATTSLWSSATDGQIVTYGGDGDTWGLSLTPAIVNSSTFGVVVRASALSGTNTANVDYILVTIYYLRLAPPVVTVDYGTGFTAIGPNNPNATLSFDPNTNGQDATDYEIRTGADGTGALVQQATIPGTSGTRQVTLGYNASNLTDGVLTLHFRIGTNGVWGNSSSFTLRRAASLAPPANVAAVPSTVTTQEYQVQFDAPNAVTPTTNGMAWEIWTGAGGTGTLIASGTFTQGTNRIVDVDADPALAVGPNTRYLRIRDGAGNWAEASFLVDYWNTAPIITDGPTVSGVLHQYMSPLPVGFVAIDAETTAPGALHWEIWTGPGRAGTKVADGSCTSDVLAEALIEYNAPGLTDGVNTLYLSVDDGVLVSDDEPFEILRRVGAQKTVALVWHTGGRATKTLDLHWHTGGRAMRTVGLIWSVEPSERRVTRALVTSPVRYEFRYELRDRNNQFIRDVTPAFDGPTTIDLNNDRATLRTARFRIRPRYGIDPLRDYVAIYQDVLVDGNYWQEIPLGLYALHAPKRTYAVTHELWDVEASDLTVRLMESTTTETFVVEASENYVGAVRTILDNLGLRHALPSHDAVLTADRKWPAGTPWLQVVNDLLNAINLYTLWFRVDGVATTRARDSLAERTPDLVLTDTNGLLLADPISVEDELTRLANQIVVVVDNPDHQPMSAVATNADPDSPISTVQLGYTRTKVITRQSAPNVETLQAIARAELEEAASLYQRATLTTAFDGRRDAHEVFEITDADLGERQRWWCRSWTAQLTTPATMKHNLGRVQRVVAS